MATHATAAPHSLETNTGLDNRKLLMWLFLASECLFFGSFIAAFLLYRDRNVTGPYPEDLYDIPFTSVSSFVLLMSSLTMVLALAAIQRADLRAMRVWLVATALLGLTFLAGQAFEFTEFWNEGLSLHQNLFGTTFFVLTGFHGAHVSVGVLLLLSLVDASSRGKLTADHSLTVELVGLYWHFVDIVWIVIFTLIYLIQPQ
ncbi:MAG TPA: cytochrome c oxidase subunit 3 [Dehalococcoidia bacterium]|jgi:cytochrome c oxidase subunit 3/cytochrome o ubiquinol oxidase subunit 3|nr:cytochrome c oxidase subunit 3 [Dehalococcoidia bacterium]